VSAEVAAVHRVQGVAVLTDGTTLTIESFYDAEGEQTEDRGTATAGIAELPSGKWILINLSSFEPAVVH